MGPHVEQTDLPHSMPHSPRDFPASPSKAALWCFRPQRRLTAGKGLLREGPSPWAGGSLPPQPSRGPTSAGNQPWHKRPGHPALRPTRTAAASPKCLSCCPSLSVRPFCAGPASSGSSQFTGRAPLWGSGAGRPEWGHSPWVTSRGPRRRTSWRGSPSSSSLLGARPAFAGLPRRSRSNMSRGLGSVTSFRALDPDQLGLRRRVPGAEAPRPARRASQLRGGRTAPPALWRAPTRAASRLVWLGCRRPEMPSDVMLDAWFVAPEATPGQESGSREQDDVPPAPRCPFCTALRRSARLKGPRGSVPPVQTGSGVGGHWCASNTKGRFWRSGNSVLSSLPPAAPPGRRVCRRVCRRKTEDRRDTPSGSPSPQSSFARQRAAVCK